MGTVRIFKKRDGDHLLRTQLRDNLITRNPKSLGAREIRNVEIGRSLRGILMREGLNAQRICLLSRLRLIKWMSCLG